MKYRHKKTGGVYSVVHDPVLIEATMEYAVVYKGPDGRLWVRPRSEFYDGRFEFVSDEVGTDADPNWRAGRTESGDVI